MMQNNAFLLVSADTKACGTPQYLVYRIVYCVSRIAQFYILNSQLSLLLYQTGRECSMKIKKCKKFFENE